MAHEILGGEGGTRILEYSVLDLADIYGRTILKLIRILKIARRIVSGDL